MKKIIVVEDDRDIAFVTSYMLENLGYQVKVDTTGANVVKWAEEWEPHLILLDVKLPYKDGVELCKDIKQRTDVYVFLFSAHASPDNVLQECNADGFISKPFEFAALEQLLKDKLA